METFLEILKYIIPSIITFAAAYLVMQKFMDSEQRKAMLMFRKESQKEILPTRLQAFERIIIFLERTAPEKLVLRVHKPGMSGKLLKAELVRTINDEFNHNLAQQIYISGTSWEMVKKSKDEIIKVINLAGSQLNDHTTGPELAQKIFEIMMKIEVSPTQVAINQLKKEIKMIF